MATIDVRRAGERFHTRLAWLDSRHSFSFGHHYDPANTHHGLLLVNNDDRVRGGTGFSPHHHADMAIVTWVLDGELEHKDSAGNEGRIYPGLAQAMSAGTGISHSEMNPNAHRDVHFVQMWVLPDAEGLDPAYAQADVNAELDRGGLVAVASGGREDAAIRIPQARATLWAGRLKAGDRVTVPGAPYAHVFVAVGAVDLDGPGRLDEGDAARLTGTGPLDLTAAGPAEVLVWEMG